MHYFCTKKDSSAVYVGLLQPLLVPESRFSSWSIDFTINLAFSRGCNTILTCVDHLTKYTALIPCLMDDKTLTVADSAVFLYTYCKMFWHTQNTYK